jgi:hypothetical protein
MTGKGIAVLKSLAAVAVIITGISCTRFSGNGYSSAWEKYPDSRWAGPDLWANRLADWEIREGMLTCSETLPLRTVHLMTRRIGPEEGNLMTLVRIKRVRNMAAGGNGAAGIMLGAGTGLDYRAASLIFHSWGEGAGLFFGIDGAGKVFIRDLEKQKEFVAYASKGWNEWTEAILRITAEKEAGGLSRIKVQAVDPETRRVISELRDIVLETERLTGNLALVAHHDMTGEKGNSFSFMHWRVRGSRVQSYRERSTGPIVTAQYTLSGGTLKMTAQLMPVTHEICDSVELQFTDEGKWQRVATAVVDTPSFTASFRIEGFTGSEDRPYRLLAHYRYGSNTVNNLTGMVRHDPVDKEEIKLLSLSCIEQVIKPDPKRWAGIDAGYFPFEWAVLYPHTRMIANLKKHKPDLLFFAGDQVYEGASPTAAVFGKGAIEDYLYKWYLWCITYRDLTINIPTITIPDDHDVYHGNLWGNGGRPTPAGLEGAAAQDAGGYKMSSRFVNMVQKTQTSHLPDPHDPQPVEQGISVYYTECNVGGVSLAVVEDRKFKSAPAELLPEAMIVNGWPQNPRWNPARYADIEDASLLGERQEAFLKDWAADWSSGTWMKAVLSQTLWSCLATLPDSATSDAVVPFLEIPDSGLYISGDRIVSDFDSDGWPQSGRNRAIRIIRKAFALHICGDQHLPSTIRYGTDQWNDAGYAIVSPATGNIFPRRWFPPDPGRNRADSSAAYTGEFLDGFGNRMTVMAVANPHKSKANPARQNELVTGYSAVTFNRVTREIELANWPGYADPAKDIPFPGWPITIKQTDNYGRRITGWLPEVETQGLNDPVIRIISEDTGEIVYTLRIKGNKFQPGVFNYGTYTIETGDPDRGIWQKIEGIHPWTSPQREPVILYF